MKEWLLILSFEIKKIIKRKSTWIAFMILLGLQIVVGFSGNLGTTYVNDTFVETHAERNKIDRKNGLELSGRPFDNTLLQEMQDAYAKIELTDDKTYILS
ncbi:MAG: hypothetical protein IKJ01_00455, partial [Lachnospiraceae bacterium]|nr:hypothetical protein [Lachnospiraceae bacterium]